MNNEDMSLYIKCYLQRSVSFVDDNVMMLHILPFRIHYDSYCFIALVPVISENRQIHLNDIYMG